MYYEDRPIERRNMSENVSLIGQRASYGTPEMEKHKLMCNDCLLTVAKRTIKHRVVIVLLGNIERDFCALLNPTIISQDTKQLILTTKKDADALVYIREAFDDSLNPHMIDELLRVLRLEQIGKKIQAKQIEDIYYKNIADHTLCINCRKDVVVNTLADISAMHFTPEERHDLASHRIINVMPLGESETGKTTLLRTIMEGRSSLATERTSVASLHRWTPPQDPDVTALLYDVGGHKSYQNTAHCFQVNSECTLNFLCHRIDAQNMKESCEATVQWFDIVQISAPKSKTFLVLTQIDRVPISYREVKIEQIKKHLKLLFQEKQDIEKQHFLESDSDANKALYQTHIQNCQDIIDQLRKDDTALTLIPQISCLPGKEKSVDSVVNLMLTFADNVSADEGLAPADQDLFKEIGTIGLKKDMTLDDHVTPVNEITKQKQQLTEAGERMGVDEQHDARDSSKHRGPEHTAETRQKLRQQYITLTEVQRIFRPILMKHYPDKDPDLEKELQKSLGNLKKHGLIRYFTGSKRLAEIVFNDISTMVNILRCIFHHELTEFPKFRGLGRELRKGLNEITYNQDVECLRKHAIISSRLIKLLLKKSGCSVGEDVVLELLSVLNVAFPIIDQESDDCNVAFIPYFLRNTKPVSHVDEEKKIGQCYHTTLALHCVIKSEVPRTFFNELMVKLYGKMYKAHRNQKTNVTWVNGLSASLGQNSARLLLLYNPAKKIIKFIIQANIKKIKGHHLLFNYVKFIVTESTNIRDAKFEGLPIVFEFICVDCLRRDSTTSCVWDIPERLVMFDSDDTTIRCETGYEELPCALLQPLPKDEERAMYLHGKLLDYLKKHYTEETRDVQTQGAINTNKSHSASGSKGSTRKQHSDEQNQSSSEHFNRTQHKSSNLCEACHLEIAKRTLQRHDVILTLRQVGRGFCAYLSNNIVSRAMRQRIDKAVTDDEALGYIRDGLDASMCPTMLTKVLDVLCLDEIGKVDHAVKIEQAYHEEIDKHGFCENCNTD